MIFDLPIEAGEPEQRFRVELDGNAYNCRVYWNAYDDQISNMIEDGRDGKWYLDIQGQNGVSIKNIALVNGADLLEPYGYAQLGSLWVVDQSGQKTLPTFDGMGDNYRLRYVTIDSDAEVKEAIGYAETL